MGVLPRTRMQGKKGGNNGYVHKSACAVHPCDVQGPWSCHIRPGSTKLALTLTQILQIPEVVHQMLSNPEGGALHVLKEANCIVDLVCNIFQARCDLLRRSLEELLNLPSDLCTQCGTDEHHTKS